MGIFDPTRLESGIALESREYRATGLELRHPAPGSKPRAIYLDANATAPSLKPVVDAVMDAMLSEVGNPASAHANGTAARRLMETARDRVSELVPGFEPENMFTADGLTLPLQARTTPWSDGRVQYDHETVVVVGARSVGDPPPFSDARRMTTMRSGALSPSLKTDRNVRRAISAVETGIIWRHSRAYYASLGGSAE